MGTRADFYIGRGKDAKWIASIAWDGYPDGINKRRPRITKAKTEYDFRRRLADHIDCRNDVTYPDDGWPWPWRTSHTTDWAYAFDKGQVWLSRFGSDWRTHKEERANAKQWAAYEDGEEGAEEPPDIWEGKGAVFPDMGGECSATPGSKRSGVIVVG